MKACRALMADRWATTPRSIDSWGEADASMAKPMERQVITSEWSPRMDHIFCATVRAAT